MRFFMEKSKAQYRKKLNFYIRATLKNKFTYVKIQ